MNQSIKDIANPTKANGGYFAPHVLVLFVIAIVAAFAGGWFGHSAFDKWSHYQANIPVPTVKAAVPYRPLSLPSSGSVNIATYPAVGNQDGQGSCAAWATAWDVSYLWRISHAHSWLRFSPRQMYSHYSDAYGGGQDGGSWPDQDAEISNTTGLLQFKALPEPPYQIDNPELPTYDAWGHLSTVDAAKHRFLTTFTALSGYSQGGGPGLVQSMKQAINAGNPVLVAFPVYPGYDAANSQNPNVATPLAGENDRGGHENVALAYSDSHLTRDGYGAFFIQNQWTTAWGASGRAWMSYKFIEQYVFGAETASIASRASNGPRPTWVPNHNPGHKAPPVKKVSVPKGGLWYVRGVVTQDTHVDISAMLNRIGDQYGVAPVGLAATAGIESSIHQYADRCCTPGDTSYGIVQETTGTVCSYVGICTNDGARLYLDNLNNALTLAGRYMRDALAYHGGRVGYPAAYGLWNCGPGLSDWFYNSYQDCHSSEFAGWWNYAVANFAGSPPPPPKPPKFPAHKWGWFTWHHHLKSIPYKDHKRIAHGPDLWWNYGPNKAGSVISREQYFPKRHHGVMTQRFQFRRLYWWPHTKWQKWIRVHSIK